MVTFQDVPFTPNHDIFICFQLSCGMLRVVLSIPQLSLSFVVPVPTFFEKCCSHHLQNEKNKIKPISFNIKYNVVLLFSIWFMSKKNKKIITFYFGYISYPNFFWNWVCTFYFFHNLFMVLWYANLLHSKHTVLFFTACDNLYSK